MITLLAIALNMWTDRFSYLTNKGMALTIIAILVDTCAEVGLLYLVLFGK